MARRTGSVHVVKNERKYKGQIYHSYLLRRSYRVGNKVKKETVANLSHLPEPLIDLIRRYLKGEKFAGVADIFQTERTLPHGHVAAVLGTLRGLGLERLLGTKPSRKRTLAVAMIVARIIDPASKLATCMGLNEGSSSHSLGEVLELGVIDVDELYAAMDWLGGRQSLIEEQLAARHLSDGSLVLYDVTSAYFEGRTCPLAKLGHPRGGKKGKLQIVIGLLCTVEGCPVSVQVFEGNTGDPETLLAQIKKLRERFGLNRVILVGDRGMITEARLREDVRPEEGLEWITALRAPAIRELVDAGSLQLSVFDQQDMAEIRDPRYPGERLIVCRNPFLAADRARTREELIEATETDLNKIVQACRRPKNKLKGKEQIGMRVGKVLNRFTVAKYFRITITENSFSYSRNSKGMEKDAAIDGFYVIRTSVPEEVLGASETITAYKGLSVAERAFRGMKSVDLKVRPIHHHLVRRVKAHVFICMLAYYVEWHKRKALAPLLFDDDHKPEAEAERASVVAPAIRSPQAMTKAQQRRTPDDLPVQSFQSLLGHLATLARNQVRLQPADEIFSDYPHPTLVQQRAFGLLGVSYKL